MTEDISHLNDEEDARSYDSFESTSQHTRFFILLQVIHKETSFDLTEETIHDI